MAKIKADKVVEAIEGSGGIIHTIAKRLGVSWYTAKKYIFMYKSSTEAYEAEKEIVIDMAESTLLISIKSNDVASAKWYLSYMGKERGYVQKMELDTKNETVINVFEVPDNGRMTAPKKDEKK